MSSSTDDPAPQRRRVMIRAWQADHVLAHASGRLHSADNYLPAHALCNNYRSDYGAKEFQMILKLGVWVANEIRHGTAIGVGNQQRVR